MLIDLHVHSLNSRQSTLTVRELLSRARAKGLDGVCITNRDCTAILDQVQEGVQEDGLLVLVGLEYSTPQGLFLVYGPVKSFPPGMDARELCAAVSGAGGAIVAAHPYQGVRVPDNKLFEEGLCRAVVVESGMATTLENLMANGFAQKYELTRVAGSDARSLAELGSLPTRFMTPITNYQEFVCALNGGFCEPASGC